MEAAPGGVWENFRMRADIMGCFAEELHDACYSMASKENEKAYMTIQEGMYFRNCINKFSVLFSTLPLRLKNRECQQAYADADEIANQKRPELRTLSEDPWGQETQHML